LGRTAVAAVEPDEAVVAARLGPDGATGIVALVPAGWRAVAVPVGPTTVPLRIGDHVDLIAGFDVGSATADSAPALTVAHDALVVAVDDQRVTVAVRSNDTERVAFAIVAATIVPALRAT
jgi:Flp pilus assembly protein CpaB